MISGVAIYIECDLIILADKNVLRVKVHLIDNYCDILDITTTYIFSYSPILLHL